MKVVNSVCDSCESEFELKFNENLVKTHEDIFCPFCSELIETIEEEIPEEDFISQEDMWD